MKGGNGMKKLLIGLFLALVLVMIMPMAVFAKPPATTTVYVYNLEPSWTAVGGGGVYSLYAGPPDYDWISPGATASYDGRQAGIIKCRHDSVEKVRAMLALISVVSESKCMVHILGVTGTIKSAKSKYFSSQEKSE